jgi:hypothetical protein
VSERRGVVLACGLIAASPIVVAMVHAITVRWVPHSDLAYTAVKSFDVFSSRTPLVGQWSSGASAAADHVAYSPGPLLFWLLALPTRWLGPSAPAVTAGLVNVAAVVGAVALARRRGGAPLMVATAVAIPLMLASLPAEAYSDPWNSSAPLLPLVLLFFVCWSLACGEYRLLPLGVLVASFAAQSHLTFVLPVALLLGIGVVGLAVSRADWQAARPWVLAAVGVAVLCWIAPLIDQIVHRPGNLVLLGRAATTPEPTLGLDSGWHAVVQAVGVVPWWLDQPDSVLQWILDLGERPGALAILTTVALLGALAAVVFVGWRRRRPELWAAGALGLALALAVGMNAASTPEEQVGTVSYTLRWAMPAGMCIWLALGWSLLTLAPWRLRLPSRPATAVGVAVAAAVALAVAVTEDPVEHPYRVMRTLDERVLAAVPPESKPRVEAADLFAAGFQSGLVYWLRREDREVIGADMDAALGSDYTSGGHDRVVRVQVQDAGTSEVPPGRVIARLPYEQPFAEPSAKIVTVTLLPPRGG